MNTPNLLKRIELGFRRLTWEELILSTFMVYGALWSVIESFAYFFPAQAISNLTIKFVSLLVATTLITIYRILPANSLNLKISNQNIKIEFGDLFESTGIRIIPISRFMFETNVFDTSLQNLLIKKFTNSSRGVSNGLHDYEEKIRVATENIPFNEVVREEGHIEKNFNLGTSIQIENNGEQYLLFAITKTENRKFKEDENCNINNMIMSLEELWSHVNRYVKDQTISMPLIGGGITGIPLHPMNLLELNLIAIQNFININNTHTITTSPIQLIIYSPYYDSIDLKVIEKMWRRS